MHHAIQSTVTAQRLELEERESVHAELETLMADIEQKIFESEQERTLVVKERNDLLNEKKMMLVYIQVGLCSILIACYFSHTR